MTVEAGQYLKLSPEHGSGWTQLARAVAEVIAPEYVTRLWLFTPMRRERREWGTAVVAGSESAGDLRVFTARYMMIVRGRDRGRGRFEVEEVGTSPEDVVRQVLAGVQERFGDADPPVTIEPGVWYREYGDESTPES